MSESFAHEGGIDPHGADGRESLDAQLEAEIADHLAAAAGDLMRRGEAPDTAEQLARGRFGDISRIKRQCWWIQKGDEVMFRTLGIALLTLLAIGVVVVALGGWQLQRSLSARTEELSAQLASLTETQQAMLAQQRPPEITGHCYLGDPSKPAADVELQVYRFFDGPDGKSKNGRVMRRIRTDAKGDFHTGNLLPGDYSILAPLQAPAGENDPQAMRFGELQTRPQFLTTGQPGMPDELDLLASVQFLTRFDESIPDFVPVGDEDVPVWISLSLGSGAREFPTPPTSERANNHWPLPGATHGTEPGYASTARRAYYLPAGTFQAHLAVTFYKPVPRGTLDLQKRPDFWDHRTLRINGPPTAFREPLEFTVAAGQKVTAWVKLTGQSLQSRVQEELAKHDAAEARGTIIADSIVAVADRLQPDLQLEITVEK